MSLRIFPRRACVGVEGCPGSLAAFKSDRWHIGIQAAACSCIYHLYRDDVVAAKVQGGIRVVAGSYPVTSKFPAPVLGARVVFPHLRDLERGPSGIALVYGVPALLQSILLRVLHVAAIRRCPKFPFAKRLITDLWTIFVPVNDAAVFSHGFAVTHGSAIKNDSATAIEESSQRILQIATGSSFSRQRVPRNDQRARCSRVKRQELICRDMTPRQSDQRPGRHAVFNKRDGCPSF